MAAVESTMLALGTHAPAWVLPDVRTGETVSLNVLAKDKPCTLLMFLCNHCPYVKFVREQIAQLAREYQARGVAVAAISSNDVEKYPDDSPEKMKIEAGEAGYTFPYLYDQTQSVAKAYRAACTPDFFVFDRNLRLVYRGQLDDARPKGEFKPTGRDLREALDVVLAGRGVSADQKPSIGCNIKWKPGNEPEYFKV